MEIGNIRTAAPGQAPVMGASAAIIAEAAKTVFVYGGGRSIEVRRPSNVTRRNARKAISAESQTKPELFGEYMLAFLVVSIDGNPVPVPQSEQQAEAIQDRIGDSGLSAIIKGLREFGDETDAIVEAKN